MATLKSVIVPGKALKGGRHKVRISLSHNGEFRYILTDIIIDSAKEFKNGQIVKRPDAAFLNTKLRGLLQRYQATLDELEYINGLTCAELVFQLQNADKYKHRTLASIYNEYIEYSQLKPGSLAMYAAEYKCITEFISENTLIENINHSTILGLDKFMRDKDLKPTTIRNRHIFLMILLGYASRCGYVHYRVNPFFGFELPEALPRQSWITVEDVKTIRDYQTQDKNIAMCRDIFMLSYYLGGINIADLKDINFDEQATTIHYVRKKTENRPKLNKYVEFDIPEEAKAIIAQYKGEDGRLAFNHCPQYLMSRYLKSLASQTGIPNLIYYSARKSFSQHAYDLGVDVITIDYILGHRVDKGNKTIFNYIAVLPTRATKAVRLVLDNLK